MNMSSLLPGNWSARPHLGFGARLLLTLVVTLALTTVADQVVRRAKLVEQFQQQAAERQHADALAVKRAYEQADSNEFPLEEAAEVVRAIAAHPYVQETLLVDAAGSVFATSRVGRAAPAGLSDDVEASFNATAGASARLVRGDHGAGEHEELLLTAPVRLGDQRVALRTLIDATALNEGIGELQIDALIGALLTIAFAIPAFYLVGGRALSRSHRTALDRARRDGLTDLENHRAFQEELRRAVEASSRSGSALTLALLDLDDFKLANDRDGHRHGDRVLVAVASALRSGRAGDRAFRLGGDEFALLLPDTRAQQARTVLERLITRVGDVGVSMGLATLRSGESDEVLWEHADAALYAAKHRGGGVAVVADEHGEEGAAGPTGRQRRALHALLGEGEMAIAFQPIWDLEENAVLGYEALSRPAPTYGFEGPAEAFEVAERLGKAHELDGLCRASILRRAGELPPGALLFVNVSPQALERKAVDGDSLARAVRAAGLSPERVVLEITERGSVDIGLVVDQAAQLRLAGFRIALDDVGAGNAGLEMLRALAVDFVKIDRSVIQQAMDGRGARAVLAAILAFADQSGAFVIAEGIENESVLDFVRHTGSWSVTGDLVGGGQGYFLGRPSAELPVAAARSASVA